jgi:hypothetical protein
MTSNTKIPKTLYYVKPKSRPDDLAYMTYADDRTTKSFAKRKANALGWAGASREVPTEEYLDNTPIRPRLYGYSRRYATDNKLVRISDPRGFAVEVPVSNFVDVLGRSTMVNGEFQNDMVWGRDGQNHVLVLVDSDEYRSATKKAKAASIPAKDFEPGDQLEDGRIYLGQHSVQIHGRGEYRRYGYGRQGEENTTDWVDAGVFELYLFTRDYQFQSTSSYGPSIDMLKSFPKTTTREARVRSKAEVDQLLDKVKGGFRVNSDFLLKKADLAVTEQYPDFRRTSTGVRAKLINT